MSRSGTLQDALRFVDEFQRAPLPPPSRLKELASVSSAAHGGRAQNSLKQPDGRGRVTKGRENNNSREKSDKDAPRRRSGRDEQDKPHRSRSSSSRRRRRKRRRRDSVKSDDYDDDDDKEEAESDESGGDDDEEEGSSSSSSSRGGDEDDERRRKKEKRRAERKKGARREHRKRRREGESSSRRAERKRNEKERDRKREERKRERRRQQQRRRRAGRLRSSEDDSSPSEDENSGSGSESAESQGGDSALRSAEQVAAGILEEFPEVENDLQQLLQTVDSGQAVDISGLPNRRLGTLLQELFQSLNLKKSTTGLYLLRSGSQPILERLSWSSVPRNQPKVGNSGAARESGSELPTSVGREDSNTNTEATTGPLPRPHENSDGHKRRVIGPAMPSAEMLEAAAKLIEAEGALRDAEAALENDPMIGPPPPAAVAEAASANDAERFEEVTRITASDVGDAYDLLGLKQGVSAGDLKKRYWKLSLLVHPDKCQHPLAHQAFMALNKAFKDLQDPLKRAEIDRKADEKLAKEEYEADRRAQLQAAQWRKLRGEEALPGDAELLRGDVKDPGRDEWMTKLPPERQAGGPPSQQNTFFSRTEKSGRGDTSAWTDTPLEKAERAKMQYLEAYKHAALTGPENTESLFEKEKSAKTAAFLDEYNQKKRSLSLLEEHQQKSKKGLKKAKKEKSEPQEDKKREWVESHPWKPWDREKDLTAGRQTMKWDDKKNIGDSLSSRFGSSDRTFL